MEQDQRKNYSRPSRLTHEAIRSNHCQTLSAWPDAVGFRSHPLACQTAGQVPEFLLAESFLMNTRLRRHDRENEVSIESYFTDTTMMMLSRLGEVEGMGFPEIALSDAATLRMELESALNLRRSKRSYGGAPLPFGALTALLRSTTGVSATVQATSMQGTTYTYRFRTNPSAGGLYPLDLYIAALNVEGLERGCWYNPVPDTLTQVSNGDDVEKLLRCFAMSDESISLSRASALFLLCGHPWRAMRKYGKRGMRFLFHDAGAMSENVHLAATGLELGSVDCASFYDDEVHEVMGWDGLYQALIHCIIVGGREA